MIRRTVYLHGFLADQFVSKIELYGDSVQRIVGVIEANFKGFKGALYNYSPGFHVRTGDIYRDNDSIVEPLGSEEELHIIPAVTGSGGNSGIFAIVLGALLITFAPYATGLVSTALGGGAAGMGAAGIAGKFVIQMGVGLILAGVSSILFAPEKPQTNERPENTPNTSFNGPVNTIMQGHPVPVGYGKLLIGSGVISAGLEHEVI